MIRIIIEIDEERDGSTSPMLERILKEILNMTEVVDRLKADVANLTTIEQSAVTLINGLAQQIRDNASDPAALAAIADSLETSSTDLAAAVTANTAPPPAPPPAPADTTAAPAATDTTAAAGTADASAAPPADAGAATDSGDAATDTGAAPAGDGTVSEPPVTDPAVVEPPVDPTV